MVKQSDSPEKGKAVLKTLEDEPVSEDSLDAGTDIMRDVLAKPSHIGRPTLDTESRINGVVIGSLSAIGEDGALMVHYPGIPANEPVAAISTEPLSAEAVGHEIALGFVNGDPLKPIVLGRIQTAQSVSQLTSSQDENAQNVDVKLDGESLTLSADREIVLKCGKSSITLTQAGKVIIKGAYLSNHSTGVNRIKGGSVQIN